MYLLTLLDGIELRNKNSLIASSFPITVLLCFVTKGKYSISLESDNKILKRFRKVSFIKAVLQNKRSGVGQGWNYDARVI